MIVSCVREWILFRTRFNEKYDIVQQFTNHYGALERNSQIDFLSSALIEKENGDHWNAPIVINQSNDEAPPMIINGHFIGGGHGEPCCIDVYSPLHGKTVRDVGAVYVDDEGTKYTLLRILNEDWLNLVSENIGESVTQYKFKMPAVGNLTYLSNGENTSKIIIKKQTDKAYLVRGIRHRQKKVVAYKDGIAETLYLNSTECDYGEIWESYDILNPATIAPELTARRPSDGYTHAPDLANYGDPMVSLDQKFIILPDGTILVDFEVKKLMNVRLDVCMGVMYQEKKDVFGGGIHRYLSKLKPLETSNGVFDFSTPLALRNGDYWPAWHTPQKNEWKDPNKPFDKIVDYFRDKDGKDKLGFACGYLPVYDGHPEKRKDIVNGSILLYKSRKAYPYFASGNQSSHFRGVAYRKFFDPEQRSSVYTIDHDGKKYIYFDIFENAQLNYNFNGDITLFEKDNVDYKIENGVITVRGNKGHATFIEE